MGNTFHSSDFVDLRCALWRGLLFAAIAALSSVGAGCDSCGDDTTTVGCDPACFPWQECVNGTCVVIEDDVNVPDVQQEPVEEPVEDMTPDVAEDPQEEAPAEVSEEPEVTLTDLPDDTPTDIEEEPASVVLCPDRLEAHGAFADNDEDPTLLNTPGSFIAEGISCDALSFGNCLIECPPGSPAEVCSPGELVPRDGCSCQEEIDLALCGTDDTDWVALDLFRGDSVTMRMIPDGPFTAGDFVLMLYDETGDFEVFDRTDAVFEARFDVETDSVDDLSSRYTVRAQPNLLEADETLPYRFLIQVGPDSRGCPSDLWDASWNEYDPEAEGEGKCADVSCVATLSGGGTPSYVTGNLCFWDNQDFVSYTETGGSDVTRRVQIQFNSSTPVVAHVFHQDSGGLVGLTSHEVCSATERPSCAEGGIMWEDFLLENGETYHVRVRPVSETDPGTFGVAILSTD